MSFYLKVNSKVFYFAHTTVIVWIKKSSQPFPSTPVVVEVYCFLVLKIETNYVEENSPRNKKIKNKKNK